jgi:hypothetical protein
MGMISRVEPDVELIEAQEDYFLTFERVGWLKFCACLMATMHRSPKLSHEVSMVNTLKLGIWSYR